MRKRIAAEVQATGPDLPLTDVRTMQQIAGERLAPDFLNIALHGGMAALGIYGVMTYTIAQRTPEIGLALGLAGAYVLGRAMQSTLYGTGALSMPVLLGVGLVLLATALIACYVPASRASSVDPLVALRRQ